MVFFPPPMGGPIASSSHLFDVISDLGLATDLKMCVDAGDGRSYSGSGTWKDVTGLYANGFTFGVGAGTTPTFTGIVNGESINEYMLFDGNDQFTVPSPGPAWSNNVALSGSNTSVLAIFSRPDFTNAFAIFGNENGVNPPSPTTTINMFIGSSGSAFRRNRMNLLVAGVADAIRVDLIGPEIPQGINVYGACYTASNSTPVGVHHNGSWYSGTMNTSNTFSGSVSPSGQPFTLGRIHLFGGSQTFITNGGKLYGLAVWNGYKLTETDFSNIWTRIRSKYGL